MTCDPRYFTAVAKEEPAEVLEIAGREVRVTHPSKLYFSRELRLTKLDLVQYFVAVARGALAGKNGVFSEIVQAAIRDMVKAGLANNADPWTTFAGSDARNYILSACPPARLWEDGPTWHVALPTIDSSLRTTKPTRSTTTSTLSTPPGWIASSGVQLTPTSARESPHKAHTAKSSSA